MSVTDDPFARRSQALGRAIRDLLADVPDVTPAEQAEQAERIRQVTDKLGQVWHDTRDPETPVETAYVAFLTHLQGCPAWCKFGERPLRGRTWSARGRKSSSECRRPA